MPNIYHKLADLLELEFGPTIARGTTDERCEALGLIDKIRNIGDEIETGEQVDE